MRAPDILIIGGGIVGMVAAVELAEAGMQVTLVDAGINAGSTANAGSLHVQMQSRFMRLYPAQVANVEASLPFYRAAADEWTRLDRRLGPFELIRKGGLMLAEGADQLAFLEAKARREERKGLSVDILDRASLDRIAPWLGPQIVGAELCREEGKLNPLTANTKLRVHLQALGVTLVRDQIVHLADNGQRIVAAGRLGAYQADQCIVAAAWGAKKLVEPFDMPLPTEAEPLHMNITEPGCASIQHLVQHAERSITLKQFSTGQIVIGGGWPAIAQGMLQVPKVEAGSLLGNVALAARLVPSIGGLRILRSWAGINTTIDGTSAIGRLPKAARILLALPGDAGYTLGPLVAKMAAALAQGREPPYDPQPFNPARFAV